MTSTSIMEGKSKAKLTGKKGGEFFKSPFLTEGGEKSILKSSGVKRCGSHTKKKKRRRGEKKVVHGPMDKGGRILAVYQTYTRKKALTFLCQGNEKFGHPSDNATRAFLWGRVLSLTSPEKGSGGSSARTSGKESGEGILPLFRHRGEETLENGWPPISQEKNASLDEEGPHKEPWS